MTRLTNVIFTLLLGTCTGAALFSPGGLSAQSFKHIYRMGSDPLQSLSVRSIKLSAVNGDVLLTGDFKYGSPSYRSGAYTLHVNRRGEPMRTQAFGSNFQGMVNGMTGFDAVMDRNGQLYVGGNNVQNVFGNGPGSERSISVLDQYGKVRFAVMQSAYSFRSLDHEVGSNTIYALSGPSTVQPSNRGMLLTLMATDGRNLSSEGFETGAITDPVKVLAVPSQKTVFAIGTNDVQGISEVLVARFEAEGKWLDATTFSAPDQAFKSADAATDFEGNLVIGGSAQQIFSGELKSFVTLLDAKGNLLWHRTLSLDGQEEFVVQGVAIARRREDPRDVTVLAAGYYRTRATDRRKAVVMALDGKGDVRWTRSYSENGLSDFEYDEAFTALVYHPRYGAFFAAGEVTRYLFGAPQERALILVQGMPHNGRLTQGPGCSKALIGIAEEAIPDRRLLGQSYSDDGFMSIQYQALETEFTVDACVRPFAEPERLTVEMQLPPAAFVERKINLSTFVVRMEDPSQEAMLRITDLMGRSLQAQTVRDQDQISLAHLPGGVYVLSLLGRNGAVLFSEKTAVQP